MSKAAVCKGLDAPLEIMEVEVAPPKTHEVRIAVGASGVCHSDLSVINGSLLHPLPAVLGHEGAGVVEEVGEGVTRVKPGDHVVISWVPQCGECFFCTHGQPELCEVGSGGLVTGGLLDGTPRFSAGGETLFQMANAGTFCDHTVVPDIGVVKVDDDLPLKIAALIGCGVLTGVGAALNTSQIAPGDTVAVIGCGGVGLNVIQGAVLAGAARVIAVDMVPAKLELARTFGATDTVNAADTDPVLEVLGLTEFRGADVAFEVIGHANTILQALGMTRRGGHTVAVGVPKIGATMELDPAMEFVIGEKQLRGCWYGSTDVNRDVPKIVQLYKDGQLKLDELISKEITLDQVNGAFDDMKAGSVARSVIVY